MYAQIFFVTSVRGNDFAPQMAANYDGTDQGPHYDGTDQGPNYDGTDQGPHY